MNPQNSGLGFVGLLILIGCFLVVRPLFEWLVKEPEEVLRQHINAATLALSGILTFTVAAALDRNKGLNVFSKEAWTSQLLESHHIMLYLPLRLIGVIFLAVSFFV